MQGVGAIFASFVWMFWFYVTVSCIWVFITVIMDVFRSSDLGGGAKVLWVLLLVLLPFLGTFINLIARGKKMSRRQADQAQQAQGDTNSYLREDAGTSSPGAEIESAKRLLDSGAISQSEFDTLITRALIPA
ncbi:SHOCT domain-containing protein [Cryobacterium adonitolivorans]|uniref:SHOCT domain-containing protein n=2 Tax=Cryobacterium adonitolivorans TaxID=1259189 RepID=A0A4R8WDN0_9MICO|nr:SHOCT domain-containing protein [Cryobacterium adonitolivorans]